MHAHAELGAGSWGVEPAVGGAGRLVAAAGLQGLEAAGGLPGSWAGPKDCSYTRLGVHGCVRTGGPHSAIKCVPALHPEVGSEYQHSDCLEQYQHDGGSCRTGPRRADPRTLSKRMHHMPRWSNHST